MTVFLPFRRFDYGVRSAENSPTVSINVECIECIEDGNPNYPPHATITLTSGRTIAVHGTREAIVDAIHDFLLGDDDEGDQADDAEQAQAQQLPN